MDSKTFTDELKALAKGVITNISYKPGFREPSDTFRPKITGSSVGYCLDDVKKAWESIFGVGDESFLCDWACQGAEFIGQDINTPKSGKTFAALRENFAEMIAETIDDLDDGEELADYQVEEKAKVEFWLGEHVEFLAWFLQWYVEEALAEHAREYALDILNNNVSGRTTQGVAEAAYEEFCRAWERWYDQTQTEGR